MSPVARRGAAIAVLVLVGPQGCSSRSGPRGAGSDGGGPVDAGAMSRGAADDGGANELCSPACGATELCGSLHDGNGYDDDCDGSVDEDCVCPATGVTRACFVGPPDRRTVGSCTDGVMHCSEFLRWGPCVGGQFPVAESCDGADNDCNGAPDDGIAGCTSDLSCPGRQSASPLSVYELRGSDIYAPVTSSWRWTIDCPPGVSPCPSPADPTAKDTSIYFIQSGTYSARVDLTTSAGDARSCAWLIVVGAGGLRVELTWDTQGDGNGNTDLDVHLHRRSIAPGAAAGETRFFTDDDCSFINCKASSYRFGDVRTRWGLADTSDTSRCSDAPHGEGALWSALGACFNPRLDIDVIGCNPSNTDPNAPGSCVPENINIDEPPIGEPFRIMVNYFSAHSYAGDTHPTVNVYCNGELRAAFGPDPLVTLRNGSEYYEMNDTWLVADVVFVRDGCDRTQCRVQPIGTIVRDSAFGPAWSF